MRPDQVAADVGAAIAELKSGGNGRPTFVVGFCFGGGQSWRLAASDLGLAGVIGFYGLPRLVTDVIDGLTAPMLLLLAGDDVATTPEEFAEFTGKLDAAGKNYEKHVYAGAPHSFFDASHEQWQDACADAWHRLTAFIERNSIERNS